MWRIKAFSEVYLGMYYYPELSVTHAENIKTNYILFM